MGMKIFWGCLLAVILCGYFLAVRKKEYGDPQMGPDGGNTQIWLSPLIFPFVLAMYLILGIWTIGPWKGLERFLCQTADIFLYLNVYFLALLVLMPLLRRHISARACATLWVIPVFLFYQVFMLNGDSGLPFLALVLPVRWIHAGILLWLAGFLLVMVWQIAGHLRFRRQLMEHAEKVQDEAVLRVWEREKRWLGYGDGVSLLCSPDIHTPLSMGVGRKTRVTLLPQRFYTEEELSLIFRHELTHLRRCDVETKMFLGFCLALCWFNPLVWIAVKKASDDLELSCDEIVLHGADEAERKKYAALILTTADTSRGYTTCLSAAASTLRYRMRAVLHPHKRYIGVVVLAVAMIISCFFHGTIILAGQAESVADVTRPLNVTAADFDSVACHIFHPDTDEAGEKDQIPVGRTEEVRRVEDTDGTEETGQKDCRTGQCNEELFDYISSLKAERLYTAREFEQSGQNSLSLYSQKRDVMIIVDDEILSVYAARERFERYYRVRSEIDWDFVQNFF